MNTHEERKQAERERQVILLAAYTENEERYRALKATGQLESYIGKWVAVAADRWEGADSMQQVIDLISENSAFCAKVGAEDDIPFVG